MNLPLALMISFNGLLWISSVVLILNYLKQHHGMNDYIRAWKNQGIFIIFLFFAIISIFWSVSPIISAYKVIILLASSIAGSVMGLRLKVERWLELLFWFSAVVIILSIAFALILPEMGTMSVSFYNASWAGIYWHRNQLGSTMALLNIVFLLRILSSLKLKKPQAALDGFFYVASLLVIYLAASAAGYLLTFMLNFSVLLIMGWLKIYPRLKRNHYFGILTLLGIAVILASRNLDFVFGLVNRNSSLTGRIPMWSYLFDNVISRSPWIGYGFGAVWSIGSFRTGLSQAVGWTYPVMIGDNGFIDIVLSLGFIGLIPFLGVVVLASIRSVKYALAYRTLINFFPLLLMLFALIANISFSLFLETESLIWLLIVAVLFMPSDVDDGRREEPPSSTPV
jgi:O-antigen ligase